MRGPPHAAPTDPTAAPPAIQRLALQVEGLVQGVGFRPFVHRLATQHALLGWVCNSPQGAQLEIQGPPSNLEAFLHNLRHHTPAPARIDHIHSSPLPPADPKLHRSFEIRQSIHDGPSTALILPDLAICPTCLAEVLDPANRRYRHPFANCTHCGPRFSIIEEIPYDRTHTSMRHFPMCAACLAEYHNPNDRRFHAQPIACPHCGPSLTLCNPQGAILETGDNALRAAAHALQNAAIVAVKGLGGFHLMTAADIPHAVANLRHRKHREEKPFALMLQDLAAVRTYCTVSSAEAELLESPQAPIVLLRRRPHATLSAQPESFPGVAPNNPCLGCMLPPTALHHLLLQATQHPLVATSANFHNEPICTDNSEALSRLHNIADLFLVHDRPIVRPLDDSVVRFVAHRPLLLRRARGYAPLPIRLPTSHHTPTTPPPPVLAVGGHLKNTVALAVGSDAFLSQHIGDLETVPAIEAHARTIQDLQHLHHTTATHLAADTHPGYSSTHFARRSGLPITQVQHHYAHLLACLADNHLSPPALGVIWDGTGDGGDGTIWGGEFLLATPQGFERVGWLRPFPLPGGETAIREPRRAALGLLYEWLGDDLWHQTHLPTLRAFSTAELHNLRIMLERGLNTPRTSSIGRFFDAIASLTNLRQIASFEGQAALELESAATAAQPSSSTGELAEPLAWTLDTPVAASRKSAADIRTQECATPTSRHDSPSPSQTACAVSGPGFSWLQTPAGWIADWQSFLSNLLHSITHQTPLPHLAHQLHATLAATVVPAAQRTGLATVALSGGCFQNKLLTELTITQLRNAGFNPVWHLQSPPNDGSLALGQLVATLN